MRRASAMRASACAWRAPAAASMCPSVASRKGLAAMASGRDGSTRESCCHADAGMRDRRGRVPRWGPVRPALSVPDRARRRVLLVAGPRGFTLPSVSFGRDHPGAVDAVLRAVARRHGIHATVLRTLARPRDPRTGLFHVALELERLDDRALRTPRGRWV